MCSLESSTKWCLPCISKWCCVHALKKKLVKEKLKTFISYPYCHMLKTVSCFINLSSTLFISIAFKGSMSSSNLLTTQFVGNFKKNVLFSIISVYIII